MIPSITGLLERLDAIELSLFDTHKRVIETQEKTNAMADQLAEVLEQVKNAVKDLEQV